MSDQYSQYTALFRMNINIGPVLCFCLFGLTSDCSAFILHLTCPFPFIRPKISSFLPYPLYVRIKINNLFRINGEVTGKIKQ